MTTMTRTTTFPRIRPLFVYMSTNEACREYTVSASTFTSYHCEADRYGHHNDRNHNNS